MLIYGLPNEAECLELLQNVIEIWFTIRGFSLAGKQFEDYKKAMCVVKRNNYINNISMQVFKYGKCL